MADENYNYDKGSEFSAMGPIRRSFDVTPSSNNLQDVTRAVMVSTDDATITGVLVGDGDESHTTFALKAGVLYPFMFQKITAVSTGSVKAYY